MCPNVQGWVGLMLFGVFWMYAFNTFQKRVSRQKCKTLEKKKFFFFTSPLRIRLGRADAGLGARYSCGRPKPIFFWYWPYYYDTWRVSWMERGVQSTSNGARSSSRERHFGGEIGDASVLRATFELKHEKIMAWWKVSRNRGLLVLENWKWLGNFWPKNDMATWNMSKSRAQLKDSNL